MKAYEIMVFCEAADRRVWKTFLVHSWSHFTYFFSTFITQNNLEHLQSAYSAFVFTEYQSELQKRMIILGWQYNLVLFSQFNQPAFTILSVIVIRIYVLVAPNGHKMMHDHVCYGHKGVVKSSCWIRDVCPLSVS